MNNSSRSRASRSFSLLTGLIAISGITVVDAAQTQLDDGVIVSAESAVAYVMQPKGGIAALQIRDGTVQWRSETFARPVLVHENRLLIQMDAKDHGELPLALLDADNGSVLTTTTLEIPASVRAGIDHGLDGRFAMQAEPALAGNEAVWRYEYRKVQGMPDRASAAPLQVAGVVEANIDTQRITAARKSAPAPAVHSVLATDSPPAAANDRRFVSANGQHTMMSERMDSTDLARRYHWRIYDRKGRQVGEFDAPVAYAPFVVTGGKALFITPEYAQRVVDEMVTTPKSLRAVDLKRGTETWAAAVRDTDYRGPYPP